MKNAVIYCRVSSDKQVREGHGLEGQEKRCRDYAVHRKLQVLQIFRDEGVSGKLLDRPAVQELLDFLESKPEEIVVIVDELTRLARDVSVHFTLREAIKQAGGKLECASFNLDEGPEGHFIETMMAASAELARNQNTRQVKNRMKARLELGYWTFDTPPGLKYKKDILHGKILSPYNPDASIIKEALEGFAVGRFSSHSELRRFLTQKKYDNGKTVHVEKVRRLLARSFLYAGLIEYPKWAISRRKGHHQAVISEEIHDKIQKRLKEVRKTPARKDLHHDFPLRGFLLCPGCQKPLTGSWSKGRKERYPFYRCKTSKENCKHGQKSFRRNDVESSYEKALKKVVPSEQILNLTKQVVKNLFNRKCQQIEAHHKENTSKIAKLQTQIQETVDKIITVKSQTAQTALETHIENLEAQKKEIISLVDRFEDSSFDFGTALERVIDFMKNPHQIWQSGDLDKKRLVQKLVFAKPVTFDPEVVLEPPDCRSHSWFAGNRT